MAGNPAVTRHPGSLDDLVHQLHARMRRRRRPRLGRRGPSGVFLRRVIAAALFVLAGLFALQPDRDPGERSSPMLVAARDLDAGTTVRASDVRVVRAPDQIIPAGAFTEPRSAVDAVLAGAARAGEPLTDTRFVGAPDARPAGDREAAVVPIRLADGAVAGLLRPGTKVDVVTAGDASGGRRILAREATVSTVTSGTSGTSATSAHPGPGATPVDNARGRLVLLTLPTETATRVAAVSLSQPVTVTLR